MEGVSTTHTTIQDYADYKPVAEVTAPRNENLADFAEASYTDVAPEGYEIDTELSGPDRRVYVRDKSDVVIAFRGTNPQNKRDIWADLAMVGHLEQKTNRFKNSLDVSRRAVEKYGKENIRVTGHSLGGSQAIYVANQLDLKGDAYNPFTTNDLKNESSKFNVHITPGDPVSSLGMVVGQKNVKYHKPDKSFWKKIGKTVVSGVAAMAVLSIPVVGETVAPFMEYRAVKTASKVGNADTLFGYAANLHDISHFSTKGHKTHAISLTGHNYAEDKIHPPRPRFTNYAEAPARKRISPSSRSVRPIGRTRR